MLMRSHLKRWFPWPKSCFSWLLMGAIDVNLPVLNNFSKGALRMLHQMIFLRELPSPYI